MLKISKTAITIGAFVMGLGASSANAVDWNTFAHVTNVEATYMPDTLVFAIDTAVGSCPAGATLVWNTRGSTEAGRIANVNAVYSGLMTAMATGKPILIYGNNTGCTVDFIHFRAQ